MAQADPPAGGQAACAIDVYKKNGLSRTDFNNGRSTKIFAEELGGNVYISFNFYRTENGNLLKTCEMPEEKVLAFMEGFELHE